MQKNNLFVIAVIALILIASPVLADSLGLSLDVKEAGLNLETGNITVEIWTAQSGGLLVYNSTNDFLNNVTDGKVDITLGGSTQAVPLNLTYGDVYYMEVYINNNDINFSGFDRQEFQSSIGNITSSFLNFTTSIVPDDNNTLDLGSATTYFSNLYASTLNFLTQITTAQIANNAITSALIAARTITSDDIADESINTTLIANATILPINIDSIGWTNLTDYPGACPAGEAVTQIGDTITCAAVSSLRSQDLLYSNETNNVNTSHIAERTITSDDLADGSVNTSIISDNTITTEDILLGTINESDISTSSDLSINNLSIGNVLSSAANATFDSDVIIKGTLFGGTPIKFGDSINLTTGSIIFPDETTQTTAIDNNSQLHGKNASGDWIGLTVSPSGTLQVNLNSTGAASSILDGIITSSKFKNLGDFDLDSNWTIKGNLTVGTGTPALMIDVASGNIGINTTSLTSALTIEGDLNVTGQTYFNTLNLSGVTFSEGNISTDKDLIVEGRIYGGSPVKIVGGINLTSGEITYPDGSVQLIAPTNGTENYVYNGSDFIGARSTASGILQLDITSLSAEKSLTNFTGTDSILTDFIYANANAGIEIGNNATFDSDVIIKGSLFGGSPLDIGDNVTITQDLTVYDNITTRSTIISDYIRPNTNAVIELQNLSIIQDLRVLGNSYLGTFTIEDDLRIGSNNLSSTYLGLGTLSPSSILHFNVSESGNSTLQNIITFERSNSSDRLQDNTGFSLLFQHLDDAGDLENISMISSLFEDVSNGSERSAISFYTGYGDENGTISNLSSSEALRINANLSTTIFGDLAVAGNSYLGTLTFTDNGTFPDSILVDFIFPESSGAVSFQSLVDFIGNVSFNDNLTVDGDTFYVDASSNRIGIGTTSPTDLLTVYDGNVNFSTGSQIGFFYQNSTGRVGIGVTSPQGMLEISNSSALSVPWINVTDGGDGAKFIIDTAGNVGIGTTNPTEPLHINTTGNTDFLMDGGGPIQNTRIFMRSGGMNQIFSRDVNDAAGNTGQDFQLLMGSTAILTTNASGNFGFGTTSLTEKVTVSGNLSTTADAFFATTSGNVGIGTTSPNGNLNIQSANASDAPSASADELVLEGSGNTGMTIFAGDSNSGIIYFGNSSNSLAASLSYSNNNGRVDIDNAGSSWISILPSGNVGIGTTAPTDPLNVVGNVNITGAVEIGAISGANGDLFVEDSVGFGQNNPADFVPDYRRLIVGDGVGTEGMTIYAAATGTSGIAFSDTGGAPAGFINYTHSDNGMAIGTNAAEAIRIDSSGNVGIGTTSPDSLLELEATGGAAVRFANTSTWTHIFGFDGTNNRFQFHNTAIDDSGTDGDLIRIPMGQATIDADSTFDSNAYDYAEWMQKINPKEQFDKADLVGIKSGKVTKNTENAELIMIISTEPSFRGGNAPFDMTSEQEKEYYNSVIDVSFIGQVPVKVIGRLENGRLKKTAKPGDYLLASGRNDGTGIAIPPDEITFEQYKKTAGIILNKFETGKWTKRSMKPIYKEMLQKAEQSDYELYLIAVGVK